jgi:Vps51/Vps67
MNSLEDQINTFLDPDFNVEASARHFFATNSENELSRKLNEMANVQSSVEAVLKQKVRQNYKVFLHANDEISRVGKDMVDLNLLIGHTQGLIQSISVSRETEHAKSIAQRRNRTSTVKRRLVEVPFQSLSVKYGDISATARGINDIPTVILNAPNDLIRLIIEQMYPQAVLLISQLQEYFVGIAADEGDLRLLNMSCSTVPS